MAKAPKPYTTRKPPEPATHAVVADWMRQLVPTLQPIVKQLDEQIRAAIPKLDYAVKWKKAYFGSPKLGWVIEMVSYDVSVNVVFFGGADFASPPPLGNTDRSRYVKLRTMDEAKSAEVCGWIKEAGRVPGWK